MWYVLSLKVAIPSFPAEERKLRFETAKYFLNAVQPKPTF
jgi:hypothetical protein